MTMMRRFGSVALAALALGAICLPPAEAAYKPKISSKMGGQAMKDVQKVVSALKAMPKPVRWTFYAEKLGLLFMPPNATNGHNSEGYMRDGAHFIGVDGMEYDAKAEYIARPQNPDTWNILCGPSLARLGREVVFSKLSSDVTAFVLENAKYHLEKMAEEMPEIRDLYLAFIAKLCYQTDGKSPYDTLVTLTDPSPNKQKFQVHEIGGRGCKFVDTQGVEHEYDDVCKKYVTHVAGGRWFIMHVLTNLVGRKDILALCPDEVKKLRANYKKKMQELGAGATEPKEDNEEETSEPSEKAESLAAKLGVTYRSKTNADRMGGQFKKDLQSVRKYLGSLSKSQRWFFMAERLGLLFMPQNGAVGVQDSGWYIVGAHFIGANGLEYDAHAELDVINNKGTRSEWNKYTDITERLGREVIFSQFPEEVAELVLQNAKYQLDKLAEEYPEAREAILARIAQLEYLPDGQSQYVLKQWKWGRGNVVNEYMLLSSSIYSFHYMDTEGKEQRTADVCDRMNTGRWTILLICAHHLGKDAILALCPEEVKKLRANYEKKMQEFKK